MPDPNDVLIDDVSGIEERPQNRREWSGALRSLALPLLIVATIVGVLVVFERWRDDTVSTVDGIGIVELPAEKNTTGRSPSTDEGRVAPDFVLETPDGGTLRFSDLQGRPVLVNFWASWCGPCRQEMPEIVDAAAQHGDELVVLAINLQENAGQVRAFADDFGMDFPIVIDRTGQVADAWRIGGPVEGIPSSYFIGPDGVVRTRVFGPMTADQIREHLAGLLGEDAS
jgi:thiol-disulfide isomerase/thioredoxin